MSKRNDGFELAAREHMLNGHPLTQLEAVFLFGVKNFNAMITRLRKDSFVIQRNYISYAAVLVRINKHCNIEAPPNLPIKEIQFSEWWIQR